MSIVRTLAGMLIAACSLFACTGPDGPSGAAGPAGIAGAQGAPGTAGPAGEAGSSTVSTGGGIEGGLPTSCLSPCHGFGGIVEQWKTSTHYAAFVANLNGGEVADWTGPGACGNCHAQDALAGRVAGSVGTGDAGVVANVKNGELEFRAGANGAIDSTYTGNVKVASVTCVTCHVVTDATDPHLTGLAWAPGSFPLQVASGADDQAYLEKSPTTAAVTGTPAGKVGTSNTCIFCHRSRKDVTNFITTTNLLTSVYWGPHEGPQADVYTGAGGYHYAGLSYGTSTHQQKLACVDCHMPDVATNAGAPNHSFYAQISVCQNCHVGATTFDVGGGQSQIGLSISELQKALNTAGYLTRSTAPPYVPLTLAQLADGAFSTDTANPGGGPGGTAPSLTADQAGALYNYIIIARGSALGVHNPKYVRQLIYDSVVAVTGAPPTTLTRP